MRSATRDLRARHGRYRFRARSDANGLVGANARRVKIFAERVAERRRELEAAVAAFVAVCRRRPDVRAVFAFGSFASGEIGPRSDLDLLVIRETSIVGIERGTDLAAEAGLGIALDLIVVTPAEYRDRLPTTSFGRTILATARVVYAA